MPWRGVRTGRMPDNFKPDRRSEPPASNCPMQWRASREHLLFHKPFVFWSIQITPLLAAVTATTTLQPDENRPLIFSDRGGGICRGGVRTGRMPDNFKQDRRSEP